MRAEKELAAQAAGTCVASPSGPKNPQAKGVAAQDAISTHMCHVSLIVTVPEQLREARASARAADKEPAQYLGEALAARDRGPGTDARQFVSG